MVDKIEIEKYLEILGLSNKEIKIYLANLELGETSIMPIVQETRLARTTIYHILEKLRDQRLIEIIESRTRRIYIPYQPRKILTLLEQKQNKLKENIDTFSKTLPELTRLYDFSPYMPKIRIFKGKEAKQIYEEILELPIDETLYVSELTRFEEMIEREYFSGWIKRRVAKGIKAKGILVKSEEVTDEPTYKAGKKYLRTIRYAPKGFKCPGSFSINGDNVSFITTTKESIGFVVTSRDFATSMKNWFRELWKVSK